MKRVAVIALSVLSILAGRTSNAAVTNLRLYHLGEADAAAVPLGPGDPMAVDSIAAVNASKVGFTFYNGTGGGGPPAGLGLAPGSSMSMRFTNVDSRYVATALTGLGRIAQLPVRKSPARCDLAKLADACRGLW